MIHPRIYVYVRVIPYENMGNQNTLIIVRKQRVHLT